MRGSGPDAMSSTDEWDDDHFRVTAEKMSEPSVEGCYDSTFPYESCRKMRSDRSVGDTYSIITEDPFMKGDCAEISSRMNRKDPLAKVLPRSSDFLSSFLSQRGGGSGNFDSMMARSITDSHDDPDDRGHLFGDQLMVTQDFSAGRTSKDFETLQQASLAVDATAMNIRELADEISKPPDASRSHEFLDGLKKVIQRIGTAYDDLVQPAELSFKFADFYQPPLNMECHFSPHATLLLVGPDDAGKLNFAIESFLTEESVAREVRKWFAHSGSGSKKDVLVLTHGKRNCLVGKVDSAPFQSSETKKIVADTLSQTQTAKQAVILCCKSDALINVTLFCLRSFRAGSLDESQQSSVEQRAEDTKQDGVKNPAYSDPALLRTFRIAKSVDKICVFVNLCSRVPNLGPDFFHLLDCLSTFRHKAAFVAGANLPIHRLSQSPSSKSSTANFLYVAEQTADLSSSAGVEQTYRTLTREGYELFAYAVSRSFANCTPLIFVTLNKHWLPGSGSMESFERIGTKFDLKKFLGIERSVLGLLEPTGGEGDLKSFAKCIVVNAVMSRILDSVVRAQLVRFSGLLLAFLADKYPNNEDIKRSSNASVGRLRDLHAIYHCLQQKHGFTSEAIPDISYVIDHCIYQDLKSFRKADKGLLEAVRGYSEKMLPKLFAELTQHARGLLACSGPVTEVVAERILEPLLGYQFTAEENRARAAAVLPALMDHWAVRRSFDRCKSLFERGETMNLTTAQQTLGRIFQLLRSVDDSIWVMADVDGDGRYDVQEFAIAAHLAYRYTCGASVPVRLPLHLVPVTKRFIDPFERSEITLEESKSRNLAVSQKRVDSSHPQELHLLSSGPLTAASSKCRKFRLHSASGEGGVGVLIAFPSSSADAGVACQARDRKKQQQLVMRPSSSNKLLVEFSSAGGINIRYQNRKRVKRVTVSASRPGVSPTASGTLEDTQTKLITVSRATLQDSEVQQQRE